MVPLDDSSSSGLTPDIDEHWPARVAIGAAGLCAFVPLAVAIIAWRGGWMPASDQASVVVRAWDTLSAHPPLVGIYSSATTTAGGVVDVYHPGPLQEWLLAVPIHVFAPSTVGIVIGAGVTVTLCLATVFVVAWRRGGTTSLATSVVLIGVFVLATGPAMLREPLHTPVATFAMVAFLGCAWAVFDGDRWLWPGAVFFGSLAGQAQVAFMVPVVIVSVVLGVAAFADGRGRIRVAPDRTRPSSRRRWPIVTVTIAVTMACWVGPAWDQLFGTGNLWALFVTGRGGDAIGPGWALSELAKTLAVPPSWIAQDLHLSVTVVGDTHVTWHTRPVEWVTAACTAAVIVWGLRRAAARRDTKRLRLGIVAVSALAGCFVASTLMPDEAFSLLGHREVWRAAGLVTWWFVIVTLGDVVASVTPATRAWRREPWPTRFAAFGAAAVAAVTFGVTTAGASPAHDAGSAGFGAVEAFTARVTPWCARGPIVIRPTTLVDAPTALGLTAMLTLRGCTVHVENVDGILPGPLHRPDGTEHALFTIDGFDAPPPGCRRIAVYDPAHPPERYRDFSRALSRLQRDGPLYLFACPPDTEIG